MNLAITVLLGILLSPLWLPILTVRLALDYAGASYEWLTAWLVKL